MFLSFLSTFTSCQKDLQLREKYAILAEQIPASDPIYIFGHKNPDLDSYGSAYAYAALLNQWKIPAKAMALGKPNLETEYVLKYFNIKPLPIIGKVKDQQKVILVDHNEFNQSVNNIEKSSIVEIIDHHRLSIKTKTPIDTRIEKKGSTATMIYSLYKNSGMTPDRLSAGFLLSAILSDTLILKSPTTTIFDQKAVHQLSIQLSLDYETFGLNFLKAGTNLIGRTAEDIYESDKKIYNFGDLTGTIGQVNTVEIKDVLERRKELLSHMKNQMEEFHHDYAILMITDIIEKNCHLLILEKTNLIHKAFQVPKNKIEIFLPGVVSRKRQIVPKLEPMVETIATHNLNLDKT